MNPARTLRAAFTRDDQRDLVWLAKETVKTAMLEPSLVNWAELRTAHMLLAEALANEPKHD